MTSYKKESLLFLSVLFLTSIISVNQYEITAQTNKQPLSRFNESFSGAKNIILMIGDGMGFEQVKLARWVETGVEGALAMDTLDYSGSITTNNTNNITTDSAAAATAIATGQKTENGRVSTDPQGNTLKTILEYAQDLGKQTGLIATSRITHATPAAFASHVDSRSQEFDIASQFIENDVNILFGGGLDYFQPVLSDAITKGYFLANTSQDLSLVSSDKVLGLYALGPLSTEDLRPPEEPSLEEMTSKAIELLSMNSGKQGFFLMVEGSQIDWEGHGNDQVGNALEAIAFDKALSAALEFAKSRSDTLVIVCADHETGGLSVLSESLGTEVPHQGLTKEQNMSLRIERAQNITVSWSGSYHTPVNVPLMGTGPGSELIGELDNTDVFDIMNHSMFSWKEPSTTTTPTTQTTVSTTSQPANSTTETSSTTSQNGGGGVPSFEVLTILFSLGIIIIRRERKENSS